MPGTLKITPAPGCTPSEVIMTLSGTAEPNGGEHYAMINWGFHEYASLISIQVEQSPDNWIPAPSSYLFSHLGETYTLRASGPEYLIDLLSGLKFPYKVYALYAPDWASVHGDIMPSLETEEC